MPAAITYGPQTLPNGVVVRPDPESVIERLLDGATVFIAKKGDYSSLYKAFKRFAKHERAKGKRIGLAQVNVSKWQIVVLPKRSKESPSAPRESGYVPKRGYYRNLALQIDKVAVRHPAAVAASIGLTAGSKQPSEADRYARWADELQAGGCLMFKDRDEAVKLIRAWRYYVPRARRKGRTLHLRQLPTNKKWIVFPIADEDIDFDEGTVAETNNPGKAS